MKHQRVILILGMHRSGTSTIARILNLQGIELGKELWLPNAFNERGYWENRKFTDVHDRLFEELRASWHDIRALPEGWWETDAVKPFAREIAKLIETEFSEAPMWGVKDPRLCRLLPLWLPLLRQEKYLLGFVFITRHPIEVVRSLNLREHFSPSKGYLLWLRHVLEAERWSREHSRVFLTYEQLLRDWRSVVHRVITTFEIPEPQDPAGFAREVDTFISPDIQHQRVAGEKLSEIDPLHKMVEKAYRVLLAASNTNGESPSLSLDRVAETMAAEEHEIGRRIEEKEAPLSAILSAKADLENQLARQGDVLRQILRQIQEQLAQKDLQLMQREARINELNNQLMGILMSKSWRLTKPLRYLMRAIWK